MVKSANKRPWNCWYTADGRPDGYLRGYRHSLRTWMEFGGQFCDAHDPQTTPAAVRPPRPSTSVLHVSIVSRWSAISVNIAVHLRHEL